MLINLKLLSRIDTIKSLKLLPLLVYFISFPPFITKYCFPGIPFVLIGFAMFAVMVVILLTNLKRDSKVSKIVLFSFVLLILFYFFQLFFHSDSAYLIRLRMAFMMVFLYVYIVIVVGIDSFVKVYVYSLVAILIMATIAYPLITLNILKPFFEYTNFDERPGYFFGLTCTNTYVQLPAFSFVRVSGLFDEPGALAYWGTYALILNKSFLKNPFFEKAIIVSLALTFSMAFYVTLIFYYILFYAKINTRNITILFVLAGTLILVYYLKDTDYSFLYDATLGRLEVADDGSLKGDTRSKLFVVAYQYFLTSPILGIGQSTFDNISNNGNFMHANLFAILAANGIVGFIILPFLFFKLAIDGMMKFFTSDLIKYVILIFLGFLQRPEVEYVFSVVMLAVLYEVLKRGDVKLKDTRIYE